MALVHRAQKGDMAAYDDLVRRYQERIYATIYHMTSNHEDANDLAQEAFIKAYQALKSFKGRVELLHVDLPDSGEQNDKFLETEKKSCTNKS